MLKLTLKVFCIVAGLCALLAAPVFFVENYPLAEFAVIPLGLLHMLHKAGVSGLLEMGGLCGWGYCSPTTAGKIIASIITLGILAIVSWAIAYIVEGIQLKIKSKNK
jgi:hypothetical protein